MANPLAKVSITGCKELQDKLDRMGEALKEKTLRSATYAGAKVIQDQAILNAPLMTGPSWQGHPPPGTLKKSIIVKRDEKASGPYKQSYIITVRRGPKGTAADAFYALWVEYGHIYRRPGQALKGGKASKDRQRATHIKSGGLTVPAYPYLRPAFSEKKGAAKSEIETRISKAIKELSK